jgi:hypothetical protein
VLFRQFSETVEKVLSCHDLFTDPALLALLGLDLVKAASMIEHQQLIGVLDGCRAVRNGCYTVPQIGLFCRHVHVLARRFGPKMRAAGQ